MFFTRKETILMLQKRYKHVSILFLFFDFRRWECRKFEQEIL